jgi:hypothetical protein
VRYGVFQEGGKLLAGFHLYSERTLGVKVLRNPPFTPQCGPFFRTTATNPVSALEANRVVLAAVADFLDSQRLAVVTISLNPYILDTLPFIWRDFKVVPRYTYILDLAVPLNELSRGMSPARRNDVSKATRDGLTACRTDDLREVRDLVLQSLARQGAQVALRHLDAILFRFSNPNNSYAFTTYCDGAAVASCFIVHDRSRAYYLLGGYNEKLGHHGAGSLALFAAIRHSKEIGLQSFDFEGSMIPAIERYFRGFGGLLTPYATVNKAWLPLEMGLKLARRRLF